MTMLNVYIICMHMIFHFSLVELCESPPLTMTMIWPKESEVPASTE